MRKIMLLAVASLLVALLVQSVALAEHNAAHVRAGSDGSACESFPNEPGACPSASPSASEAPEGVPQSCEDFADPQTAQELDQDFGLDCSGGLDPGIVQPPASAPATDQYAPALPETGGGSPALGLASVALLVVDGLVMASIVRQS